MWLETDAGSRLWLLRQRQLELIRYAESGRLVRLESAHSSVRCPDLDYGIRGRISGLLVTAGRALDPGRVPCEDPCRDGA